MSASALKNFAHEENETVEKLPTPQPWNWTYDEALDFEVACEAITMMMSRCSANLWEEKHKSNPDAERIAQIRAEMSRLAGERRNLHVDNYANVEVIINKYGPILKAEYAARS